MTLPIRITTANATTVAMIGSIIGRNDATKSAIVLSISECTEAPRSRDLELHRHFRIFIPSFSAAITFSSSRICAERITFPWCFCAVICSATSSGRKRFTGSGLVKTFSVYVLRLGYLVCNGKVTKTITARPAGVRHILGPRVQRLSHLDRLFLERRRQIPFGCAWRGSISDSRFWHIPAH